MMAKNAPTGSYAAGCPAKGTGIGWFSINRCKKCDRAQ